MTSTTTPPEATTAAPVTAPAAEPPAAPPETPGTIKVQVPRTKVWVLSVNPGTVSTQYVDSLVELAAQDRASGRNLFCGRLTSISGANVSKGRNELVSKFLSTDGEWALLLDADMVFPPLTIIRLLAGAAHSGARIVGGLCVMVTDAGPIPTLYQHNTDPGPCATKVMLDYPDNTLLPVAATGAACLLVHRSVFEAMRARAAAAGTDHDYVWFAESVRRQHWVSEDIEFCLQAGRLGFQTVVDTSLPIGHVKKGRTYTAADIRTGAGVPPAPIVAVIPVKDRLDLTRQIVGQLVEQGDAAEVVIIDNGSTDGTAEWLATQPVTVLDKPGAGIHEMWNAGIGHALERHGHRVRVAILNNDLRLGPRFLRTLSRALDDDRGLTAVSGNYDGRTYPDHVQPVTDVCANRYDGSGGLAGFAFMVRGEWLTSGYRFPEELAWWYGDNDLVMAVNAAGGRMGIVIAATVEHLGGGSQTGQGWTAPEWADVLAADREALKARWAKVAADQAWGKVRAAAGRRRAAAQAPQAQAAAHDCGRDIGGPRLETVADPAQIVASHQRQWATVPGMVKIAEDLDRYQQVILATNPDVIVECGTWSGRSAKWFADLDVEVITIDVADHRDQRYAHDDVTFIQGSSVDPVVAEKVAGLINGRRAMVVLDSDHHACHVADEIAAYAPLVSPGCYLVVEDGAVRYVHPTWTHGPSEAIEQFMGSDAAAGWERDEDIERLHPATQHPAGWLRRVRA